MYKFKKTFLISGVHIIFQWAHFPHIHFGLMPDHQPVKKANVRQVL